MGLPAPSAPTERALYVYENKGIQALSVSERVVYVYVNKGIQALRVLARAIYDYVNNVNGTLFPWLMKLDPGRQYQGGEVSLFGDGFGDTQAADGSNVYLVGEAMGVVSWSSRSPGLWPANGGAPITPAIVVTVPVDGVSGMVKVEETVP